MLERTGIYNPCIFIPRDHGMMNTHVKYKKVNNEKDCTKNAVFH